MLIAIGYDPMSSVSGNIKGAIEGYCPYIQEKQSSGLKGHWVCFRMYTSGFSSNLSDFILSYEFAQPETLREGRWYSLWE